MSFSILSSSPFSLLLLCLYSCSVVLASSIPQSFQITNLLRTVDLTKPYIRDSTALILENTSNSTQTEFFWGVPLQLIPRLSYLEVKEKKTGAAGHLFPIEIFNVDDAYLLRVSKAKSSLLQVYKVQLPKLAAGDKISLVISSAFVDCLEPYPAIVSQDAKQYLLYKGFKHASTVYTTLKQKTKIKYNLRGL
jgi:oligosaccharyltransferase complex subunit alpha (ribophorin I)